MEHGLNPMGRHGEAGKMPLPIEAGALFVDLHGANDCCEDWRACSHWPLGVPEEHGLWESQKSTASWLTVCLRFRD